MVAWAPGRRHLSPRARVGLIIGGSVGGFTALMFAVAIGGTVGLGLAAGILLVTTIVLLAVANGLRTRASKRDAVPLVRLRVAPVAWRISRR